MLFIKKQEDFYIVINSEGVQVYETLDARDAERYCLACSPDNWQYM